MPYCPECGRTLTVRQRQCAECSRNRDPESTSSAGEDAGEAPGIGAQGREQVMIARFQNGAEAGYFADELSRALDLETEVLARERFDAVHAVWSVDYILQVERSHAERGARLLQSLVEATGDESAGEATEESSRCDLPGSVWVPLILTLAAGSIACFGIERIDHRPRPPALVLGDRRDSPELWKVLTAARGTWTQKREGAPGVRELTLDPETRSAHLKEDVDGDGCFDREWDFSFKPR